MKERVMAVRRGVFRSGVHGVVGDEADMAVGRHAVEWDMLMAVAAHATVMVYGQGCVAELCGVCGDRFARPGTSLVRSIRQKERKGM